MMKEKKRKEKKKQNKTKEQKRKTNRDLIRERSKLIDSLKLACHKRLC